MPTPNVIARIRYYDLNSPKREFYSSSIKDDYLNYIDKGIISNKEIDYLDYAGNKEKSSGVFNGNGLLSSGEKKILRDKLRNTKSCIWDMVLSFEEGYGKKNIYDYLQSQKLLNKVLPKFFKDCKMNPDNITWFAGLHTNTDNRHIHLSFFEDQPMFYHHKSKEYRYRKGKISLEHLNNLKMNIEKHYLTPIEGIKRVRKKILEETRIACDNPTTDLLKYLIKELYLKIPKQGYIYYGSENMNECRPIIDNVIRFVLDSRKISASYDSLCIDLLQRDKEIRELCAKHKIKPDQYLYSDKFNNDLYRRMGNLIIHELLASKRKELQNLQAIRHHKARQSYSHRHLLYVVEQSAKVTEQLDEEAILIFQEYRKKLEIMELEQLVENDNSMS